MISNGKILINGQAVTSTCLSCRYVMTGDGVIYIFSPSDLLDSPQHLSRGFVVKDKNYLSARWPGDAHVFGNKFLEMIL